MRRFQPTRRTRVLGTVLLSMALTLGAAAGAAASAVQTQFGMDGELEADVMKAHVDDGVLMVVLALRNTGSEEASFQQDVKDFYFVDGVEQKKYHVLRDSKKEWLASPAGRGRIGHGNSFGCDPLKIASGKKTLVWVKFPAPPEAATEIDFNAPGFLPFENLPITR